MLYFLFQQSNKVNHSITHKYRLFSTVWAWKLSRSKQLSAQGNTQINNLLANSPTVTLRNEYFEPIDQTDYACFFFPDLAPGEPVIVPGQCEPNVPVMQNFDASLVRFSSITGLFIMYVREIMTNVLIETFLFLFRLVLFESYKIF